MTNAVILYTVRERTATHLHALISSYIVALTFDRFQFHWMNPTGHWRLDLADRNQRTVMLSIIALNNVEMEFSRLHSQRGDTSQKV
jgi:hypothetical protein